MTIEEWKAEQNWESREACDQFRSINFYERICEQATRYKQVQVAWIARDINTNVQLL